MRRLSLYWEDLHYILSVFGLVGGISCPILIGWESLALKNEVITDHLLLISNYTLLD